ncbi:MAG: dipeptidase [Oscillospiraceae bacterium]
MISDAHLDLGMDLLRCRRAGQAHVLRDYYIPRWQAAGVGLIVAAVYLDTMNSDEDYYREALAQLDALERELEEVQDKAVLCTTGAELARARQQGRTALLLSLEGAEPIGADPGTMEEFYAKGVRLLGLCWSRENRVGYGGGYDPNGPTDACGLKPLGKELVRRAGRLGMLVDVSHLNDGGCADVAELSERPFFASHSNARALRPMDRNLSDRTIAAIAALDGMVGVNGYSGLVAGTTQAATVSALADHTDYLRSRIGSARLGLGLDLMERIGSADRTFTSAGVTMAAFDILSDHSAVPDFLRELAHRGYTPEERSGIAGENWFSFFKKWL